MRAFWLGMALVLALAVRGDAFLASGFASTGVIEGDISTGLIAYWPLNETSGTTANDTAPATCGSGDCDGTLLNFPADPWQEPGLLCDGANDVVRIGNPSQLDFTGAASFSITLEYTSAATADTTGTFVGKRDDAGAGPDERQYQFFTDPGGLGFRNGDDWGYGIFTWANATTYDVAMVMTAGTPEVYVDCAKLTWSDQSGTRPYSLTAETVDISFCSRWEIDPTTAYQLEGTIRKIRIFNRALAPEDLALLCAES